MYEPNTTEAVLFMYESLYRQLDKLLEEKKKTEANIEVIKEAIRRTANDAIGRLKEERNSKE